jgi:hypothetical protein
MSQGRTEATDRERWEAHLTESARHFPYPPTPDLALAVRERLAPTPRVPTARRRQVGWAALLLLALLIVLMAVPGVRAAVLKALRLGAVEIVLDPTATATQAAQTPTPGPPTPTTLVSVLDLDGETTLEQAQAQVRFPIKVPAYPPDLGPPDRVFLQHSGGSVVVLVWFVPGEPDRVRLSLHLLGPGAFFSKIEPEVIAETRVGGERALWTDGPYILLNRSGSAQQQRLINGHTLIWTVGDLTYRLESDLALEEAVKIGESLR